MQIPNLRGLIAKAGPELRKALDGGAGLTVSLTHYDVDVVHVLVKLLAEPANDVGLMLQHLEVDRARVERDLHAALDAKEKGNGDLPRLSSELVGLLADAWLLASLEYGEASVRTGHFLLAGLLDPGNRRILASSSQTLSSLPVSKIEGSFDQMVDGSVERGEPVEQGQSGEHRGSVFVCYRRSDNPDVTGRIYDRLSRDLGADAVFRDSESIPLGVDFASYLQERVVQSSVVVAVIGPGWREGGEASGSLADPRDFVRIELAAALAAAVPVIPTFIGGATEDVLVDLPSELEPLATLQGVRVRSDPDFSRDADRLLAGVRQQLGGSGALVVASA